ncbi:MAG TPA: hypothetical protein DE315_02995 [Candidatus Omnitrophica bacterium]|nr:hypothetical protein [Candidatus Omnitrophota bacterium]
MFRVLEFNVLSLFRISDFGFRIFIPLAVLLIGCGNPQQTAKPPETPGEVTLQNAVLPKTDAVPPAEANSFKPFYIYLDKGSPENHYVPSGFMPDGQCLSLNEAWTGDCHSGKSCIRVEYDVMCSRKDQRWAGIYWLNPANNWGQRKGGFNLTGAQQLTFWARGDKGGEQIQEFTVGGIMGNYPDTDIAVIGPVILSGEWRRYTVDLRGKDLSYISGGIAWSTSEDVNPETCTFYLDEIRFE